ncbi:mRNA-decapping enzyme 1B isoform X1 [Xiphophorus maculatus]|uniref:5'-(N(7)-methylguanosine 5'-triphospho)-[mRNA] hydrolase n=1 Tax=Xiphophorus maculatus TaxID=8083 RepID=M4A9N9_XIPMA|nr:mRNA-decapping enzyme 1B isoform X1 [Xiphophorus maculatus]
MSSAASNSCLAAKGLDISLSALQRQDPYINNIVDVASQVALYTYNNRANEWEKTEVEGTLFIYTRLASPRHGFTIMNRLNMENLTEPITKDLDFQLQDPFLLYRNARLFIHGIWFYDKQDCQRIAQRMRILTQQEQILAQSQGGSLSPRAAAAGGGVLVGGNNEAKAVDIIQMLTKARTEYDKSTSEPKEIGGSSVLCGNPNLIKPIPVKPNTQVNEGADTTVVTLTTLLGSQHQHHHPLKSDPVPPLAASTAAGKVARPPVARTLTYEDSLNSGRNVATSGGGDPAVGPADREESGNALRQLPNQLQHCPAIAKLMQGQRGAAAAGGVLQTLSESPENRLCDNGVPLEHHHHHHPLHHQHQHPHLHHHHQEQQHDPIKRLLQNHPPPLLATSFTAAAPLVLQQNPYPASQPGQLDSVSRSHLEAQQGQQLLLGLTKLQAEIQKRGPTDSAAMGTGLSSQMQGVVSPHELLQKLQLVQQEQSLTSHEHPRLHPHPGLAPRFLGPSASQSQRSSLGTGPTQTSVAPDQKAELQFQIISPQRIPATVAPILLLSPSVFTQTKSSSRLPVAAPESSSVPSTLCKPSLQEEARALSRSQLQAALLHLIQTDSSFLDSIYKAYVSRFANSSGSKY